MIDGFSSNRINTGLGGMPRVDLAAPDGAKAEIYLHGAHVTSWIPAGGSERLFLSEKSEFHSGAAIRGGVPVIFPQFGTLGPLPRHGFARSLEWDLHSLGGDPQTSTAKFALQESQATRQIWPHSFHMELGVSVSGATLALTLRVTNNGLSPFAFTGALHTYLHVEDILATYITGLLGMSFHDTVDRATPADWTEKLQTDVEVHFPGEIDRIYYNIQHPLQVCEPGKITQVSTEGFPDAVIWNPGAQKAALLADMEPDGYRHMVCVEAAIAGSPVKLEPGETWQGVQKLSA